MTDSGGENPYDLNKEIRVEDKKLINCKAVDVNQLFPMKYGWAWEHYKNGLANHWIPDEVPMQKDVELWKSNGLTDAEKHLIMRNLGFFSTGESLVANNIVLAIFRHITNSEARQYLLRQAFEEAIHTHCFQYIIDSLGLDGRAVFNMYHEVSSIRGKDAFVMSLTSALEDPNFTTETPEQLKEFIKNLVGYYIIMEGIFFYSGFVMILSLHRQNRMTGIGEQFQFILRDETIHLNFGIDLINTIKEEEPCVWTNDLQKEIVEMVEQSVIYEYAYAKDCLPEGILGLKAEMFKEYVEHIAYRRLERIGLGKLPEEETDEKLKSTLERFKAAKNPFPWMSEMMDLAKEKNFFETRVTEYQSSGTLEW